jgi:hypothetical protein
MAVISIIAGSPFHRSIFSLIKAYFMLYGGKMQGNPRIFVADSCAFFSFLSLMKEFLFQMGQFGRMQKG